MISVYSFLLALLLSSVLTRLMIYLAQKHSWFIRHPTDSRWHIKSTPSMGGLAVFASFFITTTLLAQSFSVTLPILLCGALMCILGAVDDLHPLPPYVKLAVQTLIASLLLIFKLYSVPESFPWIFLALSVLWMTFMTNAFNLIDNMDGLSSGIALIAIVFMILIDRVSQGLLPIPLMTALLGSILGFFIFNFPPAKIFMGDSGSLFIGFLLSSFSLIGTWESATNTALMVLVPVLIFAIPIFDTTLVTVLRKFHGRPISQGGKDHSSHRLVNLGLTEKQTVYLLWLIAILFGFVAVLATLLDVTTWGVLLGGLVCFSLIFGMLLSDTQKETSTEPIKKLSLFPINLFFQRRLIEVCIDTILIVVAYSTSYLLRYDWNLDAYYNNQLAETLPIILMVKMTLFLALGAYRGFWNYIDFDTMLKLTKILFLSSIFSIAAIIFLFRFEGFSRTLFVIDFFLLSSLMLGFRTFLRWTRESFFAFPTGGMPVIIIGHATNFKALLFEIRKHRHWNLLPICAVDVSGKQNAKDLYNVPILTQMDSVKKIVLEQSIQKVIVVEEDMSAKHMSECQNLIAELKIPLVIIESLEHKLST